VDGNTSGVFTDGSITSTAFEYRAWWQVDLGAASTIQTIKIYNRTECCGDRLNNSYVFLSQQPFGTRTLDQLIADPSVFKYHIVAAPALLTVTVNQPGRYVRVQLENTNYLSLAEVQVWGN
jgi:alpha-L-fucosidase 2